MELEEEGRPALADRQLAVMQPEAELVPVPCPEAGSCGDLYDEEHTYWMSNIPIYTTWSQHCLLSGSGIGPNKVTLYQDVS